MKLAGPAALMTAVSCAQVVLAARVFARMLAGAAGEPLARRRDVPAGAPSIAALVPTLDECERLGPLLESLIGQPQALAQIIIADGGSTDGTHTLVREFAARDARIVLLDTSPVAAGWNGKMWNLAAALGATAPAIEWVVALDADVRVEPDFAASLLGHIGTAYVDAFSAAPRFELSGPLEAILHPAFLATLVYRNGMPGRVATKRREVMADGQCFAASRDLLVRTRAFAVARSSRCDDYTVARTLVAAGASVGFSEAAGLATVRMYASVRECWENWPRSLSLQDAETPLVVTLLGFAELMLVQALPLWVVLAVLARGGTRWSFFFRMNVALAAARFGVAAGSSRAYARKSPSMLLAPAFDVAAVFAIVRAAARRSAVWRGRPLVNA